MKDDARKFKRTYIACLNCRVRKVKCDLGDVENPKHRCARCDRERRDCVFVDLKKRLVGNYLDLREQSPEAKKAPKHFSTMEGALVFLANAAGKIATADSRDNIDARAQYDLLQPAKGSAPYTHAPLELRPQRAPALPAPSLSAPALPAPAQPAPRLAVPPAETADAVRPRGSNALAGIDYIGPGGILSVTEATHLVHMFFTTMHPLFPHIPRFLHSPTVLAGYPILLCAILTILSRYHALDGGGGKNIEVHDRLWLYVQRLISQTVWAEASTRSIGTVFAFLLFTEWNPRAIHWRWSDYANRADDPADFGADDLAADSVAADPPSGSHIHPARRDEPAGLGAMRRSHRMAWMLIGSAVRLAQDTGFMEHSAKTFLATHIAEINSVMNMSRRSMLSHLLAEVVLDHEDVSEEALERREDNEHKVLHMSDEEQKRVPPENALHFTRAQKAQIELLQIASLGHELLYGYKAQLGALSQRQNLAILSIMSPMINSWRQKYRSLLAQSLPEIIRRLAFDPAVPHDPQTAAAAAAALQNESFIFEFNYTKLYIYSLALSPSAQTRDLFRDGKLTLKLDEISKSAKYIEQAFSAANEILLVAHRVHRLRMLRFMPVRWVTRIVRAVAFIVKCYLTITAHKSAEGDSSAGSSVDSFDSTILSLLLISVEEIAQSIQRAAITLRDCSPDELHLCTRYSNVLMYLYSEMRTKLKMRGDVDLGDLADSPGQDPETFAQKPPVESIPPINSDLGVDNEVMDWFANNKNIGLDFVGPWTELIEQHLEDHQSTFQGYLNGWSDA